jgi:gliding motility-associated-like protein
LNFTFPIGCLAFLFSLFAGVSANAQVQVQEFYDNKPLQFTENKGQWSGDFLYKTDMGGGAAFLKRTGFTFLLQDKKQRDELAERMHGHAHGGTDTTWVPASLANSRATTSAIAVSGGGSGGENTPMPVPLVRGHAYEVTFLNAGNPEIYAEKASDSYANYLIGNDASKWQSGIKSYQLVNYKSLYPGIDMQVYSEASVLKYDLIVQPGADPSQIQLQYTGVDKLEIKKEQLIITTSVGTVTEQMPFAYQYIDNQRVSVKVSYALNGTKLRFKVSGKYDSHYPLIIDPSYIFSTVSGSQADNWGFTATYDGAGNFYGGGIVFNVGYPVTPGAVQNTYADGGFDIGISKFSSNGRNLIYATYLGGGGKEQPHSLFVDPAGNLVISGRTTSGNFPGPNGGQPTVVGTRGGWDIAVTKLNATGSGIIGTIIVASPGDDGVNIREDRTLGASVLLRNYGDDARSEVVIDDAGNIYVASCTRSDRFPTTPGAFQTNFGGAQDGVLLKIDQNCSNLLWSSFIGGSKEDAAYVLALDGTNSLYVAGGTASNNFPIRGSVLYSSYRGGICDGFVAHVSADGTNLLQSTYMGATTVAADQVYGIQLDSRGFVYIMGTTEGTWPIQQPPGTTTFYNNNSKQFIAKLQPNLSAFVYSTTFGKGASTPSISPVAFLVDRCENVYVSGWGGGIDIDLHYPNSNTNGLPLKNPLQRTTDSQDFYFFVLQRDATDILFGSYFGGNGTYEHVDGGTSRFDRNGVIYQGICAWCPSPNNGSGFRPRYPTTPGAYATSAPPNCNLGALKIAFNLDGVKAGIKTLERRTNYCVPAVITFIDTTGTAAQTWTWNFGDGSAPVVGTNDTIQHTYNNPGNYRVTLVKCDPASCNGCDTAVLDLRIRTDRAVFDMTAVRQPPCESLSYLFNLSAPTPPRPFTNTSFLLNFGDNTPPVTVGPGDFPFAHRYQVEGVYNATLTLVDTNYCNAPEIDTVLLRVAANVRASFTAPDSACVPATIEFVNTTSGGETFAWDFGDGSATSNDVNPVHTYNNPGTYTVSLHVEDNNTCNRTDDTSMVITVFPPPTADFIYSPTTPTENTPTTFTNQSSPDATSFLWEFGDGDGSTEINPVYQYNTTGVFDVYLISTNRAGCSDTAHKQVSAIVIPLFDIPSAFSPNKDGVNDVFLVRGFGIARFNMKIYNRWGQMVFETNDASLGWDGTFKGSVQPMDAYAFVINVEFSDGTSASKNGSVTLLR